MEERQRVVPRRAKIEGLRVLQSCTSTWMFDTVALRFCRVPRDAAMAVNSPTAWSVYERLEINEPRSSFVVVLDEGRTRVVRAWLHTDPCDRCRPEPESLDDSKQRIRWFKARLGVVERPTGRTHPLRPFGGWLGTANRSFARRGVLSSAICPGFVDTPMSEDAKDLAAEDMIPVEDIAEVTRTILRLSPRTYIPEVLHGPLPQQRSVRSLTGSARPSRARATAVLATWAPALVAAGWAASCPGG
jgi:hypothetical protein